MASLPGRGLAAGGGLPALPARKAARQIARDERVAAAVDQTDVWPHTGRLMPWALAVFLTMVWLIPFDNANLPVSLPLDAKLDRPFLAVLLVLWILAICTGAHVVRLRSSGVHRALAAFAIVAVVSILLNYQVLSGLHELDEALKKLLLLLFYGLFFVIAVSVIRPAEVPRLITFMLGLATLTAIGTLVEYRTGYNVFYELTGKVLPGTVAPESFGGYDSIGRKLVVGPTVHPLAMAMMMSMALPFAIVGVLRNSERRARWLHGLAAGLMLSAAVATQRKTSFVVPVVALSILFAYRPRAMIRLLPFGLMLIVFVHAFAPGSLGSVFDQLKPGAVTGVNTTRDRVSDYDAIRPELAAHPLVGRGYDSFDQKKYRILDNQYLTLIVNVGLLGILTYLMIIGSAAWYAHKLARSRDSALAWLGTAGVASLLTVGVGSALMDTLALPQLPYLFCFLAALVVVSLQGRDQPAWRPLR